jgi:hypothetical protein
MRLTWCVCSTYRDHMHALSKGSSPRAVMAELFGKQTGLCRGQGGSMHMFDSENGLLGGFAFIGEGIPIGLGAAFQSKCGPSQKMHIAWCQVPKTIAGDCFECRGWSDNGGFTTRQRWGECVWLPGAAQRCWRERWWGPRAQCCGGSTGVATCLSLFLCSVPLHTTVSMLVVVSDIVTNKGKSGRKCAHQPRVLKLHNYCSRWFLGKSPSGQNALRRSSVQDLAISSRPHHA